MDMYIASTNFNEVFDIISRLAKKETPSIVAIDGMCGSGKSYLAANIADFFDCNVFHMDDYFLPIEMKTETRLKQPGGNVHYERFHEEVLLPLVKYQTVTYRPYLCGQWKYGKPIQVEPKKLTIVEGTYSLHPNLRDSFHLKIFLTVNHKVQLERIKVRNGEEKAKQFASKWIPLENLYFNQLGIKDLCDIKIDTSDFY